MDTITEKLNEQMESLRFAPCDLARPQWELAGRVHDWRNYVPQFLRESWGELTERERKIIAMLAEESASSEEWD